MRFVDFEFDGLLLSDMGYVVCDFNGRSSIDAVMGAELEFNTFVQQSGAKERLVSSQYKEHLECTFQICKKSCNSDIEPLSLEEVRDMYSWLNRKKFYKFKPLTDEYMGVYFEGSFNVGCIEVNGKTYGMELTFISNRPFGLEEPKTININAVSGQKYTIFDTSDDEGYIYPESVEIELSSGGNLTIKNELENRSTVIKNCIKGEKITMQYPVIQSSIASHDIQDDFNWNFLRIVNTFRNKQNIFTFSLPCKVKIVYSPIAKVVI